MTEVSYDFLYCVMFYVIFCLENCLHYMHCLYCILSIGTAENVLDCHFMTSFAADVFRASRNQIRVNCVS